MIMNDNDAGHTKNVSLQVTLICACVSFGITMKTILLTIQDQSNWLAENHEQRENEPTIIIMM